MLVLGQPLTLDAPLTSEYESQVASNDVVSNEHLRNPWQCASPSTTSGTSKLLPVTVSAGGDGSVPSTRTGAVPTRPVRSAGKGWKVTMSTSRESSHSKPVGRVERESSAVKKHVIPRHDPPHPKPVRPHNPRAERAVVHMAKSDSKEKNKLVRRTLSKQSQRGNTKIKNSQDEGKKERLTRSVLLILDLHALMFFKGNIF